VIGVIVVATGAGGDKGPSILRHYKQHSDKILVGSVIWLLGVILFFWFLGSLRSRLLAAEGGLGRLASIAWGGGLVAAAIGALWPAPDAAGALNKSDLDASAASALHHLGDAFFIGMEYTVSVLLFATALLALRTRVLPIWFAWASIVVGIVLLIGPIGWAALLFGVPLWVIVTSVLLWTRPVEAAARLTPASQTA
jgi:hypothetical protein